MGLVSLTFSLMLIASFKCRENYALIKYGYLLCITRQTVYFYDPYGNFSDLSSQEYHVYTVSQVMLVMYLIHLYYICFDPKEPGFNLFGYGLLNLLMFSNFAIDKELGFNVVED